MARNLPEGFIQVGSNLTEERSQGEVVDTIALPF